MTDYEYLIHLLYCFIHDTVPQEKPEEVSFEAVLKIGKMHEVANAAFLSVEKLKNKPPQAIYDEWKLSYYFSVQRDFRQQAEYERVTAALHGAGIRTLEAQGTVMKKLYPATELRMMSDIDFILDVEHLPQAKEILKSLGYEITKEEPTEFNALLDGELLIEFHTAFFQEQMYNRRERYAASLSEPFAHAVTEDGLRYYLNDTYFYLYSLLHTIKHFETAGCGIRRVMDLYYCKQAYTDTTDTELIHRVLADNDCLKSYEALSALEAYWFEGVTPSVDLTETIADVLTSGNHGTGTIFVRNNLRKDKQEGIRFAKLKKIKDFILPSKEYIYLGYPVCRERGYSTARSRLYRIFATLRRFRFSHTKAYIRAVLKSK